MIKLSSVQEGRRIVTLDNGLDPAGEQYVGQRSVAGGQGGVTVVKGLDPAEICSMLVY